VLPVVELAFEPVVPVVPGKFVLELFCDML